MRKILLIEDNETIILGLKYSLEQEKFEVDTAKNIVSAKTKIKKNEYDLYLLDISLPDGEGYEICKQIKQNENNPVIFLTAKDEEKDIVQGLDMGADDYVVKPFRTRELISRINSVLRRYEKNINDDNQIKCGNIVIDTNIAKVYKDGKEIVFTSLEYKILLMLLKNKDILITREQILDKIWDVAGNFVNDNTLTVYIKRIREKIDDKDGKIIQTVRGIGYRVVNTEN
ncbi:MAG: response regulator transcription factor [Clostridia bacterium]|nr:response regulator transcription factor [Clostridia bacterium]